MTQASLRSARRRPRPLTLPIDVDRATWWALVELLYCVQRDVRHRCRMTRTKRWWKALMWMVGTIATSGAGVMADNHFHVLGELAHLFG